MINTIGGVMCDICDSKDFHRRYKICGRFDIIKCRKCGLWLNYPLPSKTDIDDMYSSYHEKWGVLGEDEALHRRMRYATFDRLLGKIEKVNGSRGRRLLDIGCATGICMEAARNRGWDVYGVDISEKAINTAKIRFGSKIEVKDLVNSKFPSNFYDVVIITDVLEHLVNIRSATEKIYDMLKPGGVAVIVTVNTDSLYARFMGRYWVNIRREHLTYFSKKNLMMLLKKIGFKILRSESSFKSINLYYLQDYMKKTREDFPGIAALCSGIENIIKCLPFGVKQFNFMIPTGDITVFAKKI